MPELSRDEIKQRLWEMVFNMVNFPYPQICRHSVACDLLSLLEETGDIVPDRLAAAVVQAQDLEANSILKEIGVCPTKSSS